MGSATYTFGSGANSIQAGDSAANTLTGGLGRDLIFGNAGNDTITGGGGTDLLVGGAGNDTLTGGTGDDVLVGGTGNDILTGGGGNNRFVFAEAGPANVDTITDYSTRRRRSTCRLCWTVISARPTTLRILPASCKMARTSSCRPTWMARPTARTLRLWPFSAATEQPAQDLVHVHFGNTTHDMSA